MLSSQREETEGKLQMRLSPRKNGLTSLFKEVRVFKVCLFLLLFLNVFVFFFPSPSGGRLGGVCLVFSFPPSNQPRAHAPLLHLFLCLSLRRSATTLFSFLIYIYIIHIVFFFFLFLSLSFCKACACLLSSFPQYRWGRIVLSGRASDSRHWMHHPPKKLYQMVFQK